MAIEQSAYEICVHVLGPAAEEWIRERWDRWRPETFLELAAATAVCLPFKEGFGRVTQILEDDASRNRLDQDRLVSSLLGNALAPFRSSKTLDWIERHPALVTRAERGTADLATWGRAAAFSHFSWPRAVSWLEKGRPLSLIAMYAINTCVCSDAGQPGYSAPILEEHPPSLLMLQILEAHCQTKSAARERTLVQDIRSKLLGDAQ